MYSLLPLCVCVPYRPPQIQILLSSVKAPGGEMFFSPAFYHFSLFHTTFSGDKNKRCHIIHIMCCDSAFYDLFSIFTSFFRAGFLFSLFIFRSRRFRFLPFAFGYLSFIRRGISFSVGPHSVFLLCILWIFLCLSRFAFSFRLRLSFLHPAGHLIFSRAT